MTAATLLTDLMAKGIVVSVADGILRLRSPHGALTPADRAAVTARKAALLALVLTGRETPIPAFAAIGLSEAERQRLGAEARAGDGLAQLVLEATAYTPEPVAWRLFARRLDRELWVVRDVEAAAELDQDGVRAGLPVVLAADLERWRAFDDQRLRDLLDVLAAFPGSRLAALDPEAAS